MTAELSAIFESLTPIQRIAVNWNDEAALVLAGPGAGKTRVLTARIARILDESRDKNFRILALTFTTKAAREMRERVEQLVPGLVERAFIGTFHAFCVQILRQHGSHIGLSPDFGIYDQDKDRESLLADALREAVSRGESVSLTDVRWLGVIDRFRANLVLPEKAASQFRDQSTGIAMAQVYRLYEKALLDRNVMDYNGLILETCRLFRDFPLIAAKLRRAYPHWLIDEFQDTSPAQNKLIQLFAGEDFRNIFAVADDDQIIYQWAGASYRQIELFRKNFKPELIQLVENYRCPPEIVEAANRLVAFNTRRTPHKELLVAAKTSSQGPIEVNVFNDDVEEQEMIAKRISESGPDAWGKTAILGRTRFLLTPLLDNLKSKGVKAVLAQRRDRFISPQFVWLQACLDQAVRPSDKQVFTILVDAGNRISNSNLDPLTLIAEAEANGQSNIEYWGRVAKDSDSAIKRHLGSMVEKLVQSRIGWRKIVRDIIPILIESAGSDDRGVSDAGDDHAAWQHCFKEILAESGGEPDLSEFVQGLALRSKEPPADPHAVSILTVHAAKGLEFDVVFLVGLAESVMPSWQSIDKGIDSAEMEEERRNCFVAITRTREYLVLTRAKEYKGRAKQPSRFLAEMGFQENQT